MKSILEKILAQHKDPEKTKDKLFKMLYLDDIVDRYEWNKDRMNSWKIIRKAIYWYAIGSLTEEEVASVDENDLSVDTMRLSNEWEDRILMKMLTDIAYQSIKDSKKWHGPNYIKSVLLSLDDSTESDKTKARSAEAIWRFTVGKVYLVDARITKPAVSIIDKICK